MANYARTTALKADSIFGPTTIADEQIAFSNQIRNICNKIRTATQNGASDVEIGVLNQHLMMARDSFNAAVQAKVTRLVGNEKAGADNVKMGRETWWVRVCLYGKIWVVEVTSTKKKRELLLY